MSLLTRWGYALTTENSLPDMLTAEEYNAITGNRFSGDVRIAPAIKAASQAIRNYCSWHVAPSLACKLTTSVYDKRVTRVQDGVQIQLPAMFVSSITSIKVGGEDKPIYILDSNGMLLVMDVETGSLLADAQYPTYDLNAPGQSFGGSKLWSNIGGIRWRICHI